ncbi:MAG: hypothetical protein ACRD68_07010, partial [Pyrinomonadaceae bacterium]
ALLIKSVIVSVKNPVFGVGMGNFPILSIRDQVTHNSYTQVSSEMGVAALVIYIMFLLAAFKGLKRVEREAFASRHKSHFYYLAVGLQAALAGYMVSSFFGSVAYQWYVYYLVGYAVCFRRIHESSQ